jgi:predicted DNA-binding transcriptional regulator AlpA
MKKYNPNDKELSDILKMYNEELLGSQTISEKTGISKPTILRILKENGIIMGPSGRRNIGGKKVADKKWRDKNKEKLSKKHKLWYENIIKLRKIIIL